MKTQEPSSPRSSLMKVNRLTLCLVQVIRQTISDITSLFAAKCAHQVVPSNILLSEIRNRRSKTTKSPCFRDGVVADRTNFYDATLRSASKVSSEFIACFSTREIA